MKKLEQVDLQVIDELKKKVALGCRILAKLELSDYLGHVSARVPETDYVLIKARGLDAGNLLDMTPDKVLIVDIEGRPVEGDLLPPDEVKLHTEIFRYREDVQSVVHTHQPVSTVFGDLGLEILPMQGVMASVLKDEIPVFPSSRKIVSTEQAAGVAKTLGGASVIHLRNHGIVTVGSRVEEAVINAIWLEHQAKLTMQAMSIGKPTGMSREEVLLQIEDMGGIEGRWNYYTSLLDK